MVDAFQSLTNHVTAKKNDPKAELTNYDRHQKEGSNKGQKRQKGVWSWVIFQRQGRAPDANAARNFILNSALYGVGLRELKPPKSHSDNFLITI